jgi:site-specific DNA-methyltransferase (adenine-specific)
LGRTGLTPRGVNDVGGQSRYFDLDAWARHHGFLDVPKPSTAERDMGLNRFPLKVPKSKFNLSNGSKDMRFDGVIPTPRRNVHPTVKPVKLMAYLIELGCPKGGIVLDPFVGSGTTCIAAKRLRRKWIGIEINPEYAEIARARVNPKGPLDWLLEAP